MFFLTFDCKFKKKPNYYLKVWDLDALIGVFFFRVGLLERCIVIPIPLVLRNSLNFLFWNWFPFFLTFCWVFLKWQIIFSLRMDLTCGNSHKLFRGISDKWSTCSGWVSLLEIWKKELWSSRNEVDLLCLANCEGSPGRVPKMV